MKYAEFQQELFTEKMNIEVAEYYFKLPKNLQLFIHRLVTSRRKDIVTNDGNTEEVFNQILQLLNFYEIIPVDARHLILFIESKIINSTTSEVKKMKRKIFKQKKDPARQPARS